MPIKHKSVATKTAHNLIIDVKEDLKNEDLNLIVK